jgi:hypothetical protein
MRIRFNDFLDSLVRPTVQFPDKARSTFRVMGYLGLLAATTLTLGLAAARDLSSWVMSGIVLLGCLTFLGLAMLTKLAAGEEVLVYYHHEIAVLLGTCLFLWLVRQPILVYLDLTILGVGAFLIFGRLGCLMVGCCYGRPGRWGVCYGHEMTEAGFAPWLVGVRLFPVQALESLWVLFIVLVGSSLVLMGSPPGAALAWYVVTYGLGRFVLEFKRGDPERRISWGFSEAQWISLLLILIVTVLEIGGLLPFQFWHMLAAAGLLVTMLVIAGKQKLYDGPEALLERPSHLAEVARATSLAVDPLSHGHNHLESIPIHRTGLGVQISAGLLPHSIAGVRHYGLSYEEGTMTEETAARLAALILQLRHPWASSELISTERGVYHLIVYPDSK